MAEGSDAEKKHAPSFSKLKKARDEGQIRRSNDLPKAAMISALTLIIVAAGGATAGMASAWLKASLRAAGSGHLHAIVGIDLEFGAVLTVFIAAAGILAFMSGIMSGGWLFSITLLFPKIERIDPAKSWGQIFSVSNLIEVGKSAIKIIVIGGSGWAAYTVQHFNLLAMAAPKHVSITMLGGPTLDVIGGAVFGAIILAAADVAIQAWLYRRSLKMTDQELRDEIKSNEGDPQIKAKRRALMRRAARERQNGAVKTATMVVTNPTHFAVAVRYRRSEDKVPIVIAKGADVNAPDIISEARAYGIPIVEAPPLARALYRQVEPGNAIPSHLYRSVAEVLAYIWRLEEHKKSGGIRPQKPIIPDSIETARGKPG
jgi:flagellar biosynthetic protein FlhB